ncbi:TonB-dependent siderophore receptor [Sphingobium sp. BS19]|uniref:TonB-dependent receptor plug domain-containing protein n=1 Tax=Sphingobium sp. BS19 TaxID=3018973 RepID=UPI0022EEC1AD|nr:TonB-dependent receptor [Sphingobium sp. BS19]GLI99804.1 TonB-dependent receptor [Sphingobium sp. BS19]
MPRYIASLLSLTALVSPVAAFAEDAPDTIVVTATRTEQPLSRVGQSITVIDREEIATRQTDTIVDILRTVPGVTIARTGGIGGVASVFIRGAESDQTVALIDGVKLNDPSSPGGGFNFGNLMTGNIARIEVLRGPQSVLWGSQAIGGVVNLITIPPSEDLAVNLRGEYGYRDTGELVGNVSGKAGPVSASLGAGYFRTDGISAFNEKRGGKEKDGYRNYGANANVNVALSDAISVDLRGWYSNGRNDQDGFAPPSFSFGDTLEYTKTRDMVGYAGLNAALLDGRFRNRLGFAYTDIDRVSYDGASTSSETFAAKGRNERFEYQGSFDIAEGWQTTFGAEREKSRLKTSNYGFADAPQSAVIESVYGQLIATPFAGFTATGGVRYDHHNRFGSATTFGANGVWTPNAGKTELRASYSEGFKAPSLYQLYGDYGNDTLRPERARAWDAGVTQRLLDGAIEASATWFHRNSRNLIDFISCSTPLTGICTGRPFGTYDNIVKARSQGLEVVLALRPVEPLKVQASYTYLDAENRSPGSPNFGNKLARRPAHSVNAAIDYRWSFGLTTGATITHVGSSFDNAANSRRVEGYALADIRASFPITKNVEIYGRVENLFNERYETVFRYGTPGRAAYGGVRVSY